MRKVVLLALTVILPLIAFGQSSDKANPFDALRYLEGTWEGAGEGMSGTSEVTQNYEFIMGGRYLRMTTKSVFEPQEKNPEGEIHEDLGIFSYDRGRETIVLRAFYIEGFVNTYVLTETSDDGRTLTFETIAVENAPEGTKAKLVFSRKDDGTLEQKFFVAFPGQELSCFSTNRLNKK